mmetsp:Transcript_3060/g.7667  ORF Transcript_3060/g.7667 Transcript_3060/m.7667 type:complete len:347 (+) Transcript_3060:879-1919(+)
MSSTAPPSAAAPCRTSSAPMPRCVGAALPPPPCLLPPAAAPAAAAPCTARRGRRSVAQRLHARRVVHAPDGLAQQVGHRQDGELGEHVLGRHRDGVGHNHLLKHAAAQALNGGRREDGVAGARVHLACALRAQHLGRVGDGARRVDHVVHQHRHLALDVADEVHDLGHVVRAAALVHDRKRRVVQLLGERARARHTAHIWRHHHQVPRGNALGRQVVQHHTLAIHVVHRDVKVPDALPAVQVHGQHTVGASLGDQVCCELGGDRLAALRLAVRARVAVVGDDGGDGARAGALARVNHDQQLHEVVVDGRAGGLHQEHVAAADRLANLHVDLAVRKPLDLDLTQVHA